MAEAVVVFCLLWFLVMGIVGYIGWFFKGDGERTFTGMVGCWCSGFTMVVCGILLYSIWFEGLELP